MKEMNVKKNELTFGWIVDQVACEVNSQDLEFNNLDSIVKSIWQNTDPDLIEEEHYEGVKCLVRVFYIMNQLPSGLKWNDDPFELLETQVLQTWPSTDLLLLQQVFLYPEIVNQIEHMILYNSLKQLKDTRRYLQYRADQGVSIVPSDVEKLLAEVEGMQELLTSISQEKAA